MNVFYVDLFSKLILLFKKWVLKQTILSFFCICLALLYCIAFVAFLTQYQALIGDTGLLPAKQWIDVLQHHQRSFWQHPSVFWFYCSSTVLATVGVIGLVLSILCLSGRQHAVIWLGMWVCYLSIVHVGQVFYGYGWESLLLETGFFTIFLCPFKQFDYPRQSVKTNVVSWLVLWILFRNMFGAGLIKLRGDRVWHDFTALYYHFETQPVPNPLSWFFHHLPPFILRAGVAFNHVAELIFPVLVFSPFKYRRIGAVGIVIFQFMLILSGNLSWLNYLTLVQCLPAFQTQLVMFRVSYLKKINFKQLMCYFPIVFLVIFTVVMSRYPIANMIGSNQQMNAAFNHFFLLNTYGAFGHVGKERYELVVLGTTDTSITSTTVWKEYLFKAKPNRPKDRLPIVSPFHYRLDWQIWFAAMVPQLKDPWLLHFVYKLLIGDQKTLTQEKSIQQHD